MIRDFASTVAAQGAGVRSDVHSTVHEFHGCGNWYPLKAAMRLRVYARGHRFKR